MKFQRESGQALLIVLLTMAVVLTIVLSILSRSVTDIAVTSRGEEAIRAFSAAEAGVEQALIGAVTTGQFEGASFEADVQKLGEGFSEFLYPLDVRAGDSSTIWFVSHDGTGSLVCDSTHPCYTGSSVNLCWGKSESYPDAAFIPAVEASIFYLDTPGDYSTIKIARAAYDPNVGRTALNKFDPAGSGGCTVDGTALAFSANVDFSALGIPSLVYSQPNGVLYMVVRFLYNTDRSQAFGVTSGVDTFPSQGKKVDSTGTSGESTRKVTVLRLFSDLPPTVQSAIFAPAGITK